MSDKHAPNEVKGLYQGIKLYLLASLVVIGLVISLLFSGCAVPPGASTISGGGGGGGGGAGGGSVSLQPLYDIATYKNGGGFIGVAGKSNTFYVIYPTLTHTDYSSYFQGTSLEGFDIFSLDFYTDTSLFMVLYDSANNKGAIANVNIGATFQMQSTEDYGPDAITLTDYTGYPFSLAGLQPIKVRVALSGGSIPYAGAFFFDPNNNNSRFIVANTSSPLNWKVARILPAGDALPAVVNDFDWVSAGGGSYKVVAVSLDENVYVLQMNSYDSYTVEYTENLGHTLLGVGANFDPSGRNLQFPVVLVGNQYIGILEPSGTGYQVTPVDLTTAGDPDVETATFLDVAVTGDTAVAVGYNAIKGKGIAVVINIPTRNIVGVSTFTPDVSGLQPTGVTFLPSNVQYVWISFYDSGNTFGKVYYSDNSGSEFSDVGL